LRVIGHRIGERKKTARLHIAPVTQLSFFMQDTEVSKGMELKKREWCWIMKPQSYEITCDLCGGSNLEWSEFEHMVWCYDCQKDTLGEGGLFNGPIPLHLCFELGFSFDRIDIAIGKRLYLHEQNGHLEWKREPANNSVNSDQKNAGYRV
jgi:hypothetical protein